MSKHDISKMDVIVSTIDAIRHSIWLILVASLFAAIVTTTLTVLIMSSVVDDKLFLVSALYVINYVIVVLLVLGFHYLEAYVELYKAKKSEVSNSFALYIGVSIKDMTTINTSPECVDQYIKLQNDKRDYANKLQLHRLLVNEGTKHTHTSKS